jgi:threonine/homoserine/homoserine lactone efflux protein
VLPVTAGLAESVAVTTLVALVAVPVIAVVPGLRTTILFSRCCSGGVQEGFYVEFGHGDEEAGFVLVVVSGVVWKGECSLQVVRHVNSRNV